MPLRLKISGLCVRGDGENRANYIRVVVLQILSIHRSDDVQSAIVKHGQTNQIR